MSLPSTAGTHSSYPLHTLAQYRSAPQYHHTLAQYRTARSSPVPPHPIAVPDCAEGGTWDGTPLSVPETA
eukprot:817756-Rhodomonas_salina.1